MANNNSNSWLGFKYPISDNNPHGLYASQSGTAQIKSDLLILLLTSPGERCNLPNFGTPLKTLIFEPADNTLVNTARQMIISSIQQWEPRVAIDQINVSLNPPSSILNPNDDGTETQAVLLIQIQFRDPDILTQAEELVLEVPLPGS